MTDDQGSLDHPVVFRAAADEEPSRRFPWMDLARATGGETISGNELTLQFDGPVTFGMWLDSIAQTGVVMSVEDIVTNTLERDDNVITEWFGASQCVDGWAVSHLVGAD